MPAMPSEERCKETQSPNRNIPIQGITFCRSSKLEEPVRQPDLEVIIVVNSALKYRQRR